MTPRTAKEIIDEAIHENRFSERLLYLFAILFVVTGIGTIIFGVITGNILSGFVGCIAASLFWPAMESTRSTRKENISIRLLEAALNQADTAKEAAEAISQVFENTFAKDNENG